MSDMNETPDLSAQLAALTAQMNEEREKMRKLEAENANLLVQMEAMSSQTTGVQPSRFQGQVIPMQPLGDLTPVSNSDGPSQTSLSPSVRDFRTPPTMTNIQNFVANAGEQTIATEHGNLSAPGSRQSSGINQPASAAVQHQTLEDSQPSSAAGHQQIPAFNQPASAAGQQQSPAFSQPVLLAINKSQHSISQPVQLDSSRFQHSASRLLQLDSNIIQMSISLPSESAKRSLELDRMRLNSKR